jgi:WD40 repeat protein
MIKYQSSRSTNELHVLSPFSFSDFPHPIRTIYDPYHQHYHQHEKRLSRVAFSSDGKHIITASDGNESVVKLWQWSYGSDGVDNANGMFT